MASTQESACNHSRKIELTGGAGQAIKRTVIRDVNGLQTGFPKPQSAQAPVFTTFPPTSGSRLQGRGLEDASGRGGAGRARSQREREKPRRRGAEVSGPRGFPPGLAGLGLTRPVGRDGRMGPPGGGLAPQLWRRPAGPERAGPGCGGGGSAQGMRDGLGSDLRGACACASSPHCMGPSFRSRNLEFRDKVRSGGINGIVGM